MQVLKVEPYKICQSAFLLFGFGVTALPYFLFVQKREFGFNNWMLLCLLVAATPLAILAYYKREYLVIDKENLQISTLLRKTVIPIRQIQTLSYQFTGLALMLFVHYEIGEVKKWRGYVMDFMSTNNIRILNEGLSSINPNIEIKIDTWSQKAQVRNAKPLRFVPKTRNDWIKACLIWFCMGALVQLVLLFALVPRS